MFCKLFDVNRGRKALIFIPESVLIYKMGNSVSLEQYGVTQPYEEDLWQLEAQREYCKIYRNLQTGQLCEEYLIELPSGKIKDDI